MALGTPTLLKGSGVAAATHTTVAATPAAACRLHAHVNCAAASADPALPTFSDSTGLTWTQFYDFVYSTGSNPRLRQTGFWADVTSPASMTFTAASTGSAAVHIQVAQQTGTFSSDYSNQANGQGSAGASLTLPNAPTSTNTVYGSCFASGGNSNVKPGSYTNLQDSSLSTARRSSLCYDTTSPAQSITWTSSNLATQGIAYEAKEDTGASVNGSLSQTIDPVTQTATGTLLIQGSVSQTIDDITQVATGSLPIQATLNQTIGPITQSASGNLPINGSVSQTIGAFSLSASGVNPSPPPPTGNDNWLVRARRRGIK